MIRYVFALMVAASMFLQVQPVFSQLLQVKPAHAEFKETVVNVDGDPFKGSKDAKVALIEFSDYQ